ncbi:MAG: hypothetical protein HY247_08275 [archaeon]|nr:MAG: hypothetical protein HY247_08275 [archaeon]
MSTEMVEDSVVDLIYGHLFGWKTLIKALIIASIMITFVSALVVFFAATYLQAYLGLVQKGAAILLGMIGAFWFLTSIFGKEDEIEEAKSRKGNLSVALQLVSVEEVEIVLIISHWSCHPALWKRPSRHRLVSS